MEDILNIAIESVKHSEVAFTKYITANDTGATGGHQAGFHMHKNTWPLFFERAGVKGENKDNFVTIKWQNDFETTSRFIYYGVGTRNEYRLTRFGKGFPFLKDSYIGDLLVICKREDKYYEAFVITGDDYIETFLLSVNISSTDVNAIIPKPHEQTAEDRLLNCFRIFIESLNVEFPPTVDLALNARNCFISSHHITEKKILSNPDKELLNWIDTEFQLFKAIENDRYNWITKTPFESVEGLVLTANTILNRRKSRAGKSLEHHLSQMFNLFKINFSSQTITEGNKRPDFLFPSESYHNPKFDQAKLVMLASKTTCKDRWRQILNEADRIKTKHLFTLQQGISTNQLDEMYRHNVCLVVPKPYLKSFPEAYRERIMTLDSFIGFVMAKQT